MHDHVFARGGVVWYCVVPAEWISPVDPCVWDGALVFSCSVILFTCVGSLMILPVMGSRMDERFVGAVCFWCFFSFEAGFKMDLKNPLVFLRKVGEVPRHICYSDLCWHV